uniref:Bulb-type lectin domain-containing protein n=1 Tax=Salix viminalis TaxID=40686 RepID=A0A6N2M3Q6_SALVM
MNAERLFLYSLLLILHFISCASKDSINTTKIIRDGDVLISKGNSFALGFFSPGKSSNRYLGICEQRNVSVWSTNVSGEEADTSVAQLLDSGNFVVVQESGNILWQSFDSPTHYVLPGMKLGLDLKKGLDRFLSSWRSADDPGIGDYSYRVNPSGSPQIFLYKGEKRVWRTSPWPWRPQRRSYNTKFVNDQDEIGMATAIPADDSVMTRLLVVHTVVF